MSVISKLVTKVFGKKSDKDLRLLTPFVDQINDKALEIQSWQDDQLRERITHHKQQIDQVRKNVNTSKEKKSSEDISELIYSEEQAFLDSIMVEVFAIVKDSARRLSGTKFQVMGQEIIWEMVHYDVQLIGGVALHQGKIAEMKTGEGKTLVSTLPIVLNAITGRGVHVITVNDYLAQRDSQWMGILFEFLGLTVGCILNQMSPQERKTQYACDVTYGTNNEFGFDYLRDNMAVTPEDQVQTGHVFGIVDEVDSVLIDEARTPLIISGQVDAPQNQKYKEYKHSVENVMRKQSHLVNGIISEAEKSLETDEYEAGTKLLIASRGMPKHKRLMKIFQQQGTKQLVHKIENDYLRDKKMNEIDEQLFFSIDEKSHIIDLTESGREALSPGNPENFVIPDMGEFFHEIDENPDYDEKEKLTKKEECQSLHAERSDRIHAINQLLRAYTLFEKDVDYIVQDRKVLIVDEHTGRVMHGRRYSDGLHQALESKENVEIERESQTMATITIQNYFRQYEKLAGMTGTASTEAQEFMEIYKLDVVEIPTNQPIIRNDNDDQIYRTKREKYNAIIEKIIELNKVGEPILVGTTSVDESETLSRMLRRKKVAHNVLNAKQHQREAEIITNAGGPKAVTISTNMAGRGTDIKLGDGVKALGGLYILGTGRHESRRIDLQLRGRAGRQGDPGESTFFISLEDDLMRLFASERMSKMMDTLGFKEGEVISHPMVTRSIGKAQKRVESRYFSIRKHLLEYDDVLNQQREVVYDRRNFALRGDDINQEFQEILKEYINELLDTYCGGESKSDWNWEDFRSEILSTFSLDINEDNSNINNTDELRDIIIQGADAILAHKKELAGVDRFEGFKKFIILKTIDEKWREHLAGMDQLREGINLRAYGQKNPLIEYKREGFGMFADMMTETNRETLKRIYRVKVGNVETQHTQIRNIPKNLRTRHDDTASFGNLAPQQQAAQNQQGTFPGRPNTPVQRTQPIKTDEKIGRNDPCPCGSGKKYKKCHG